MTPVMVAGAMIGAGVWFVVSGLRPAREPLAIVLSRLGSPRPEPVTRTNLDARFGAWARRLRPIDEALTRVSADMRILGRNPDEQAGQMLAYSLIGVAWGPGVVLGLRLVGVTVPWVVPVWLALVGGVACAVLPLVNLRHIAAQRREEFSFALGAFLDVLSTSLAGGRTTKAAVDTAAAAGQGWAFEEIRVGLAAAYVEGLQPWDGLATLGAEAGIDELSELAAALTLAGEEGAAVRTIVRGKARVIRERTAAAVERKGGEATERMTVPALMLAFGFFAFWGFPAYVTLTNTS